MHFMDDDPSSATASGELEAEPALADPGITDHADDLPIRFERAGQDAVEPGELCVPSDQPGEPSDARGVEPSAQRPDACELEHPDGSAHPLHRPDATVGEHEIALDQSRRVL